MYLILCINVPGWQRAPRFRITHGEHGTARARTKPQAFTRRERAQPRRGPCTKRQRAGALSKRRCERESVTR